MSVLVVAWLVACAAVGFGLTGWTGLSLRFEERAAVSGPVGVLVVGLATWVLAIALGFDLRSSALGLVAATALSLPGWWRLGPTLPADAVDGWRRVRLGWREPDSLRPLVLLLAVAWPVTVRIFSLAWMSDGRGGVDAGHLASWADGSAHLAYAGRFVAGGEVPIASPIAAGEPARYHLLADAFGAQVSLLGVSLPSALAVASGFLALFVPAVLYVCGVRWVGGRWAAVLGTVVFCAGGTLGWASYVGDVAAGGWDAVWPLARSYARRPEADLWMDNPSLSYLHAQRNGLLGLPLGLVALTLLRWEEGAQRRAALASAGVLVGLVPLASGHAWVVVLAVAGAWFLLDPGRVWGWFFGPALVLGAPAAIWLLPEESALRWLPGWMADGGPWGWVVFWGRNLGPFLVLVAVACLWRGTVPRATVRAFLPFWLLWLVPNLVAFHPWEWNNTKYVAFFQLVGSFLVGAVLVRWWREGIAGRRWAGGAVAVVALVAMCGAGVVDLARAMDRDASRIGWASADAVAVSTWLRDETDPEAVVVAAPEVSQPAIALSGRRFVSGYPGWTFDLGVPDWRERAADSEAILRGGPAAIDALDRRGVDLVVVGPIEAAPPHDADLAWWAANGRPVFEHDGWVVYEPSTVG
ncbi:MAG: hypothetical protein KDA98_16855 [Acidimicrobiales bacterium]|nr:hypothetical protein [Acidimicrobiales bacterium]